MTRTMAERLDSFVYAYVNSRTDFIPMDIMTLIELAMTIDENASLKKEDGYCVFTFKDGSSVVYDDDETTQH